MFSLSKIHPRVFHLKFDSSRELSMTFVRYTEFYESKYDHIRGQKFTLVQQMAAYCREHLGDNDRDWSYTSDWTGYNIPAEIIADVSNLGIIDPNHYDWFMFGVYEMIMCETMDQPAYLIGTSNTQSVATLRHEMTHAMFYVDKVYQDKVLVAVEADKSLHWALTKCLMDKGYPEKVVKDEINAYITTGEGSMFEKLSPAYTGALGRLKEKLVQLHREHFDKFYETPNLVG